MELPDPEKTYNTIWKDSLICKLRLDIQTKYSKVPLQLIKIIKTYINNNQFKVKINDKYFNTKTPLDGFPQGGVLSPNLFNIFINDIFQNYLHWARLIC